MGNNKFDERELQIRGRIFRHGIFTAMPLLLANAFLASENIIWANGFHQNILIIMIITTVMSIESHIHGVYFGRNDMRGISLTVMTVTGLILIGINVWGLLNGDTLISGGQLSAAGFSLSIALMLLINIACGVICAVREKRAPRREKE